MDFRRLIAYVAGGVEEEILLRNEYLAAENRILKDRVKKPLRFKDAERRTPAEIGVRLGKKALADVATLVQPGTDPVPCAAGWDAEVLLAGGGMNKLAPQDWRRRL